MGLSSFRDSPLLKRRDIATGLKAGPAHFKRTKGRGSRIFCLGEAAGNVALTLVQTQHTRLMMRLSKTGKIAAPAGLTARRGADSGFKLAKGPPHKDSDNGLPA